MINYAGCNDKDNELSLELTEAGIKVEKLPEICRQSSGEVKTIIIGSLHGWTFTRSWRYWVASGPGIPPVYATPFHKEYGKVVRVAGHCGCPSPIEWYKGMAVPDYHIDTQVGLNAFARMLEKIVAEAKE
jgi:hypothetical protein